MFQEVGLATITCQRSHSSCLERAFHHVSPTCSQKWYNPDTRFLSLRTRPKRIYFRVADKLVTALAALTVLARLLKAAYLQMEVGEAGSSDTQQGRKCLAVNSGSELLKRLVSRNKSKHERCLQSKWLPGLSSISDTRESKLGRGKTNRNWSESNCFHKCQEAFDRTRSLPDQEQREASHRCG